MTTTETPGTDDFPTIERVGVVAIAVSLCAAFAWCIWCLIFGLRAGLAGQWPRAAARFGWVLFAVMACSVVVATVAGGCMNRRERRAGRDVI